MEITALVSFGALLVAWIVAPSSSTVAGRIAPSALHSRHPVNNRRRRPARGSINAID